jgi:hypothetical protein
MKKEDAKTVEINGEEYVRKADVPDFEGFKTSHVIVLASDEWIFEGYRDEGVTDKLRLANASVVRKWSNGRGIGGLAKAEYKHEYTLDPVGLIELPLHSVVGVIYAQW